MRSARLVSILLNLQLRGRLTARELAERLEVSERTIYRDVEALGFAGVPLYSERGPHGGFKLVDGYKTQLNGLTTEEAKALFAAGVPGPLAELGLAAPLVGAQLKLLIAMPESLRQIAERTANRFHVDSTLWFRQTEPVPYLPALQTAVWNDRKIRADYSNRDGEEASRILEPLALVLKGVIWYLVGGVKRPATYRVSRFRSVELLEDSFSRPAKFDLSAYWAKWSEEFEQTRPKLPTTIRVTKGLLDALPQILGDSARPAVARAVKEPDGRFLLQLEFESREAACYRTLLLGADAEVIEPPEVRKMIGEVAVKIARNYESAGS
ncbi:MAG: helix-turn-helix transcriptional regulator [Acidimicrobiia bacterium]